jgi:hypothetical protein
MVGASVLTVPADFLGIAAPEIRECVPQDYRRQTEEEGEGADVDPGDCHFFASAKKSV